MPDNMPGRHEKAWQPPEVQNRMSNANLLKKNDISPFSVAKYRSQNSRGPCVNHARPATGIVVDRLSACH